MICQIYRYLRSVISFLFIKIMPEFEESAQKDIVPVSEASVEKSHAVTDISNNDIIENHQSDVTNDAVSAEKHNDGNAQNGRYLLKRGRLPQSKSVAAVEKRTSANVVDVEHDAIGIRADNAVKRQAQVKKTTRVVDDGAEKTNVSTKKRQPASRSKESTRKQVVSKTVTNKSAEKAQVQPKCVCCCLKKIWEKFVKIFSYKKQQPTKNRFAHEGKQRGQQSKRHGNNKSHYRHQNNHKKSA